MSFEPEPGQSLEQQAGALDDPTVPERAGAIVTEVITSIADETRARAEALQATAETEAKAEVDAARDASGRVVQCLDDLAGKLGELRSGIRQEEGLLSNSLGQLGSGRDAPLIAPPRASDRVRAEPVVDAEVVEDESSQAPAPTEAHEQPPNTEEPAATVEDAHTIVLEPDDNVLSELGRMNDDELGQTYVDAVRLAHEREQAGMDAGQAHAIVDAVLDEARGRPAFTEAPSPERGFRARLASVTGRRMGTPTDRLREAVSERRPGG